MTKIRDVMLFVALAVAWGTAFTAIEIGLESLPPILFAAFRFDIAAFIFIGAALIARLELLPRTREDLGLIIVTGTLIVGAHFGFLFTGQTYVTSGTSAIILSLTPIITPILALQILPNERLRFTDVLGLIFGLLGVTAIAASNGGFDGQLIGIILLLTAAFAFALGSVLTQRWTRTLPLVSLQAWGMAAGALTLHTMSYLHPSESLGHAVWTAPTFAALGYLGIVSTALAFLLYFLLLDEVGATNINLISYATPIVAAVAGTVLLGESITGLMIIGFLLILTGFGFCKIRAIWKLMRYSQLKETTCSPNERTVRVGHHEYHRTPPQNESGHAPADD